MNDALLESLINQGEGTTVDYKRDQYPFAEAGDNEKSEPLKDILAFANAWRTSWAIVLF
jgi:hypothetical protein